MKRETSPAYPILLRRERTGLSSRPLASSVLTCTCNKVERSYKYVQWTSGYKGHFHYQWYDYVRTHIAWFWTGYCHPNVCKASLEGVASHHLWEEPG